MEGLSEVGALRKASPGPGDCELSGAPGEAFRGDREELRPGRGHSANAAVFRTVIQASVSDGLLSSVFLRCVHRVSKLGGSVGC